MTENERTIFDRLLRNLTMVNGQYDVLDRYYNGAQVLEQLGLAVPPELDRFTTIVNWPRMGVDAVEERLDIEGFRLPDEDGADEELWRVWKAMSLGEESQLAHLDAMIFGRSYATVGANEGDGSTPIVTVESPREMVSELDVRTRRVRCALRVYDPGEETGTPRRATLYLPDVTVWLRSGPAGWGTVDRDDHRLGVAPVVPLVNRPRTSVRHGVSEMADIIPLTDAAARSLTNLQLAQETHAVPQRGVLGASKGDFVDADGNPMSVWEAYFGAVWALQNADAKTFQFDASDLKNFETAVNLYARQASGVTGLPPHYFGFTTDNPASADAIRSTEARLVKRSERKATAFGGSWGQVARLIRRVQSGEWDPRFDQLETLWRDPATPTVAQRADATAKLVETGVLPVEMAWEDLGWSPQRQARAREHRRRQFDADVFGALADQFRADPET